MWWWGFLITFFTLSPFFSSSEFAEQFEIQLTGATGGAVLGLHLVSQITIAKSDSPLGIVRFLNKSRIILPNPDTPTTVSLVLERTGRLLGDTQVGSGWQRCWLLFSC